MTESGPGLLDTANPPSLQGAKVLLHLQRAETAAQVRGLLEDAGAFRLEVATPELAPSFRDWRPDLVLVETEPLLLALSVACGRLRALAGPHSQSLVAVIPHDSPEARLRAANAGFDAILEVPLSPDEATARLGALVARFRASRDDGARGMVEELRRPDPAPLSSNSAPGIRDAASKPEPPKETGERFAGGRHQTVDILRRLDGSRRFTEALLAQIHSGVVAADGHRRITFANRSATEALGLDIVHCTGRDLVETFGGSKRLAEAVEEVAESQEIRVDVTFRSISGARLNLGMTVMKTTGLAPSDMAYVVLFRDISEKRRFELELRRVERMNAIGNMVAGFAHEIRNPLAGMQALAETLLIELPEDDPRREYPTRMLAQLSRVDHFLRAALQFAEPKPAHHTRIEASTLVKRACDALIPRWGRRGLPPTVTVEPGVPVVDCDPAQIGEALVSLLENAIDAVADPARVRILVRVVPAAGLVDEAERVVQIDVTDDGPGVAEELQARIFDPFFTTKANGTGLGLPLALNLVRENGGRLLLSSRSGPGATFSILLPEVAS